MIKINRYHNWLNKHRTSKPRGFVLGAIAAILLSVVALTTNIQQAQVISLSSQSQIASNKAGSLRCAKPKLNLKDVSIRVKPRNSPTMIALPAPPAPPVCSASKSNTATGQPGALKIFNLRSLPLFLQGGEGGICIESGQCFGGCSGAGSMQCESGAMAQSIDGCSWRCCWCSSPGTCSGFVSC